MSISVMGMVWKTPLEQTSKLVMLALADWSNESGICWPSSELIAQRASTKKRNLRKIMADLEQAGLISRRLRGRGGVLYQLNLNAISALIGEDKKGGTVVPPFSEIKEAPQCPVSEKRRHSSAGKGAPQCLQNLKNLNKDLSPPLAATLPGDDFQDEGSPKKKNGPQSLSPHAWVTRWWCWAFSELTGGKYHFNGKDAKIIKVMIDTIGMDQVIERACTFLTLPEKQRFPNGAPTLTGFQVMVNQLTGKFDEVVERKCVRSGILPNDGEDLSVAFDDGLLRWQPWNDIQPQAAAAVPVAAVA